MDSVAQPTSPVPADLQPEPATEPATRGAAGRPRDLIISLVVLLVPVLVIVAIFRLRGGEDAVTVDPGPALAEARAAGAFGVAEPAGLGPGWRPVSARFQRESDGAVLRIGYLTPSGGGVQLIESSRPADALLDRELGAGTRPAGPRTVGEHTWQAYATRAGEPALVRTEPGRTLIVIGRTSEDELIALATSVT
jgi:hypothetical protein